jgi:Bacterial regulatory proteins, luxR family
MGLRTCARQNRPALDVLLAVFFVLLDTAATLAGASWWPAHPGMLAWAMLAVQALADASLVFRRRAPIPVIAILAGFTLVISLLISPAGLITPENAGKVWAPFGTVLAAYGLSNAQIASRLYLSEATVKGYVSRMLVKLGCANRTQAGLLAHDAGIVSQ